VDLVIGFRYGSTSTENTASSMQSLFNFISRIQSFYLRVILVQYAGFFQQKSSHVYSVRLWDERFTLGMCNVYCSFLLLHNDKSALWRVLMYYSAW